MADIRTIRHKLGLTQDQMAEKLGVTQATVSRFETGVLLVDRRTQLAVEAILLSAPRPARTSRSHVA